MLEKAYIATDLKSFYASVAEPLRASALRGSHPLRGSAWSGDLPPHRESCCGKRAPYHQDHLLCRCQNAFQGHPWRLCHLQCGGQLYCSDVEGHEVDVVGEYHD